MLDGLGTVEEYVERAVKLKMPALAVTDHGNICATPSLYWTAREAGIEPVLGEEFYFVPDIETVKEEKNPGDRNHVVILARGEAGFRVLSELSTESHKNFYHKPLIDRKILGALGKDARHLVCLSGCAGSIVSQLALTDPDEAEVEAKWWSKIFPNFFIEIQHHDTEFDRQLNKGLVRVAKMLDLPLVITNDPHYVMKSDCEHHDALLAIQTASDLDDPNRFRFDGKGYHLRSHKEMKRVFSIYPEAVWKEGSRNTLRIAKACRTRIPAWESRSWHIPSFPDADDAYEAMKKLAVRELRKRGLNEDPDYVARLKHELRQIRKVGMADFLMITRDFHLYAEKQGIRVGPGRGSVCGTLVGYLIGVHKMDPVQYRLLFERFLNPERPKMPDIDTDFQASRRDEMFEYGREKYGSENIAFVAAYQTMKIKGAFQSIAGTHGINYVDRNRLSAEILEDEEGNAVVPKEVRDEYPGLSEQLEALRGRKSAFSKHPAGMLILDPEDPIRDMIPTMWIASSKRTVGQYDLAASDRLGLMKQDFLSLRTLDTIDECLKLIKERHGVTLDPDSWVPDEEKGDRQVYKMLTDGFCAGVFQMEGGCLPLDTPVLTPTGWKPIGDLKTGDRVVDPDGDPNSEVSGIYFREDDLVYRITFSDGTWIEATSDHQWAFSRTNYNQGREVGTTADVIRLMEQGYHIQFPKVEPPDLESGLPRPLDPYVLGALLGDGSTRCGNGYQTRFTTADEEILDHLRSRLPTGTIVPVEGYDYRILGIQKEVQASGIHGLLSHEKYVPDAYLWSPASVRLDVLRGLMDTDGTIDSRGRMEFTSTSKQLAEDVLFLVRSLGGKAGLNYRPPTTRDFGGRVSECRETWRVQNIRFGTDINLFLLSRKASKVRQRRWHRGWNVQKIEVSRKCDVACIEVTAPSHLYVTKDWIVSHNTNRRGIQEIKPTCFEDIVSCTSLYRLGPMEAGAPDRFLKNKRDKKSRVPHESLDSILSETWGEMIYQEQMFQILNEIGGLSWAEVDDVKTAMTRKDPVKMGAMKDRVMEGLVEHGGIPEPIAFEIWQMIESQSAYLFNRSHAVAYSFVTYQTARLKFMYPLEFYAALMRTVGGKTKEEKAKRETFLAEAIKWKGFRILPPHINKSGEKTTPEGDDALRMGFFDIKGIAGKTAPRVVENRPKRGYRTFEEVEELAGPQSVIKALVGSGACEAIGKKTSRAKQEELVSWTFHDAMSSFRNKWEKNLKRPKTNNGSVRLYGEIVKIEHRKTRKGGDYYTWVIRWAPGDEFKVTLWESACDLWDLKKGTIVRITGRWNMQFNNLAVGESDQVKVMAKGSS